MKVTAIAATVLMAPALSAKSQFALSELERATGWISMSDEASRSSWEKPDEGWTFDSLTLRRADGAKSYLGWNGVFSEFEIDFDWRESPAKGTPWHSGRMVVRRDNSAFALLGDQRIDRAPNSDLPSFRAGPFEMTPAQTQPGWRIALRPGETAIELRGMHLRDRERDLGKLVEIFDRKTLKGWRALGDAKFSVENGELVGEVGGGAQSFLCTEQEFGDFVFEVEIKNELPGNSGIQVRSHENDQKRLFGYQIEIDPSARAWSGGLYDEARRGWLDDLSDDPHGRAAFKSGEWNRYRIECIGPWIRAWVNEVPTADYLDAKDLAGVIGLQVHSGSDTKIRWRNFRLRELGRSRWDGGPRMSFRRTHHTGHGYILDPTGAALILSSPSDASKPDNRALIEGIEVEGPDGWMNVPLETLDLRGGEVLILYYPPRIAIEIDGHRIAIPPFEVRRAQDQDIRVWVEGKRAWRSDVLERE